MYRVSCCLLTQLLLIVAIARNTILNNRIKSTVLCFQTVLLHAVVNRAHSVTQDILVLDSWIVLFLYTGSVYDKIFAKATLFTEHNIVDSCPRNC